MFVSTLIIQRIVNQTTLGVGAVVITIRILYISLILLDKTTFIDKILTGFAVFGVGELYCLVFTSIFGS